MVLFNTIDVYTAIKLNWLSVAWVAQWVEHVNIALLYFKLCVVSSNPARGIYFCNYFKDFFLFLLNVHLLQNCFSILINLISCVTITFTRRTRNTVLQLSPVASSVF